MDGARLREVSATIYWVVGCWVVGRWVVGRWVVSSWVVGCWVAGCWMLLGSGLGSFLSAFPAIGSELLGGKAPPPHTPQTPCNVF